MSSMEFVKVVAYKLPEPILHRKDFDQDSYDYEDALVDNNLIDVNGEQWKIEKEKYDPYGDTIILNKHPTQVEFISLFYNGGGCIEEITEDVIKQMKEKDSND